MQIERREEDVTIQMTAGQLSLLDTAISVALASIWVGITRTDLMQYSEMQAFCLELQSEMAASRSRRHTRPNL